MRYTTYSAQHETVKQTRKKLISKTMSPNLAFSSSTNQLLLLLYYYFQLLFKWHIFRFSYVTSPQVLNKKMLFSFSNW